MPRTSLEHFDKFVGERIREARLANKLTQRGLSELLGVSFQQVQKYETGANRVATARLDLLTVALNRPLRYFLPGSYDVRAHADPIMSQFIASPEGLALAQSWPRVPVAARRGLVGLIEALAKKT